MEYILNEIKKHPKLCEEDLIKLIYQRTYGPKHILLNVDRAKQYLISEMNSLSGSIYEDIEIGNNLIRVDLHNVKNIDVFFNAVLKTCEKINGTFEEYKQNYDLLIKTIKDNNLNYDLNKIESLFILNSPIHHSKLYNELYTPHYRIVDKDIYNSLFR